MRLNKILKVVLWASFIMVNMIDFRLIYVHYKYQGGVGYYSENLFWSPLEGILLRTIIVIQLYLILEHIIDKLIKKKQ